MGQISGLGFIRHMLFSDSSGTVELADGKALNEVCRIVTVTFKKSIRFRNTE